MFLLIIVLHVELYFQRPPGTRVLDGGLSVLERVHLRQQLLWLDGAIRHCFQRHGKVTAPDGDIQTKHVRNSNTFIDVVIVCWVTTITLCSKVVHEEMKV